MDGVILASDSDSGSDTVTGTHVQVAGVSAAENTEQNSDTNPYGIGATLLAQMGYKPGQGLGVNEDGRRDFVQPAAALGKKGLGNAAQPVPSRAEAADASWPSAQADQPVKPGQKKRRRRKSRAAAPQIDPPLPVSREPPDVELHAVEGALQLLYQAKQELAKPLLEIDLSFTSEAFHELETTTSSKSVGHLYELFENGPKAIAHDLLGHENSAKDLVYLKRIMELVDKSFGSLDIYELFKDIFYPRVFEMCLNWTEDVGNQMARLYTFFLTHKMTYEAEEIEHIVGCTLPQQNIVEYLDEWWPACYKQRIGANGCCEVLKSTLKLGSPVAIYENLSRWKQNDSDPMGFHRIIADFEDGFDGSDAWRPVFGPEFPFRKFELNSRQLINSAQARKLSLADFEQWHASATAVMATDIVPYFTFTLGEHTKDTEQLIKFVLRTLDEIFDDGTAHVDLTGSSANSSFAETLNVTFKDVVEAECEAVGACLRELPGKHYKIERDQASFECVLRDETLIYKQGERFLPISVHQIKDVLELSHG